MKKIGFLKSEKENERRIAIVLDDIKKIKNKDMVIFQKGYGEDYGFSDDDILQVGCKVASKEDVIKSDIICDPKIGDVDDLSMFKNKVIFGWIHATRNYDITQSCIDNGITAYAWEKMYHKDKHTFSKNNQIAGKAAVLHAMTLYGKTVKNLKVAVIGNGNTAKGALQILKGLGAKVDLYTRKLENEFKEKFKEYDIIVNCVLWDVTRTDHLINISDLNLMKKNALIIDVSCDKAGAIESSIPTTIEDPIYFKNGIMHYVVDHTPSLLYKEASESLSKEVIKFVDDLVDEKNNKILDNSLIIKDGIIIDEEINIFQNR